MLDLLLHGVNLYSRQCPTCGQTWAAQLTGARVIRIGSEVFRCKCGIMWPTGRVEWTHVGPEAKRSYFFSPAEAGTGLICLVIPPFFGYFIAETPWRGVLTGAKWGAIVGGAFVGVLWAIKSGIVALSLRRCPNPLGTATGWLPWEW